MASRAGDCHRISPTHPPRGSCASRWLPATATRSGGRHKRLVIYGLGFERSVSGFVVKYHQMGHQVVLALYLTPSTAAAGLRGAARTRRRARADLHRRSSARRSKELGGGDGCRRARDIEDSRIPNGLGELGGLRAGGHRDRRDAGDRTDHRGGSAGRRSRQGGWPRRRRHHPDADVGRRQRAWPRRRSSRPGRARRDPDRRSAPDDPRRRRSGYSDEA